VQPAVHKDDVHAGDSPAEEHDLHRPVDRRERLWFGLGHLDVHHTEVEGETCERF